jgi:hypothetical protein
VPPRAVCFDAQAFMSRRQTQYAAMYRQNTFQREGRGLPHGWCQGSSPGTRTGTASCSVRPSMRLPLADTMLGDTMFSV